jgi:hypothetical protein
MYNAQQGELNNYNAAVQDIINQCFVESATWGLSNWESFLGITTDHSKDIDYRRSVIRAKLRGYGTVTIDFIKNVSESFTNGQVDVIDNPAAYSFEVKFIDALGAPPNILDLQNAINDIKPAHLAVTYTFKYLLIKQIDGVMTLNEMQSRKLTDFAPFIPV